MKQEQSSKNICLSVLRAITLILLFFCFFFTLVLGVVSSTAGSGSFYTKGLTAANVKTAVMSELDDYYGEKSRETSIPAEVLAQGCSEQAVVVMVEQHANDLAAMFVDSVVGGVGSYAVGNVDFRTPINAFGQSYCAEQGIEMNEEFTGELESVASACTNATDEITNVLDLSFFKDFSILRYAKAFFSRSDLFFAVILLASVVLTAISLLLYRSEKVKGAVKTVSALWGAATVAYGFSLALASIKLVRRLPITDGSALYFAASNLISSFQNTLITVSAISFFLLLAVLIVLLWKSAKVRTVSDNEASSNEASSNEASSDEASSDEASSDEASSDEASENSELKDDRYNL